MPACMHTTCLANPSGNRCYHPTHAGRTDYDLFTRVCIAVYSVGIECLVSEYTYSLLSPQYLGSDIVIVLFCLPNYPFGHDT